MHISIFMIVILPALLAASAMFDLTSYTIPNFLPAAMILAFAVFAMVMAFSGHPMGWLDASLHVFAGALGLAAGMAMFAAGWIGGGDAKLFAASALWLGWSALLHYVLLSSILGGVLTIGLVGFRHLPLPRILASQGWIMRLADRSAGIPYGVALATAALIVLPDTEIFRLAALA